MKRNWRPLLLLFAVSVSGSLVSRAAASETSVRELRRMVATEAHQAVAVDATSVYAIANRTVGRYKKGTNTRLAEFTAPANSQIQHLNSGMVFDGRLYCAHSNWPTVPLKNTVEIFEAESLRHLDSRQFPETEGAINWIERHRDAWWVVFAFYGDAQVRRTRLIRFNDAWQQTGIWTFPEAVIQRFLPNSNSGGAFGPNGKLYVTGHDHAELYVLQVPTADGQLQHVATVKAPIAGQGIAWDRTDIGTVFGIVRNRREVVTMRLSHNNEFTALKQPVTWVRDESNPVVAPRKGEFDSTRCMNPWVVKDGSNYRLFYSGGADDGTQRIGVGTCSIADVTKWKRSGPLFETGAPGSFDARWCVLPHVVRMHNNRWHLYYTGNAGTGSGLSAFPGIGMATSNDGRTWVRDDGEPVISLSGEHGDPDAIGVAGGSVISVNQPDGTAQWRFYYTGCPTTGRAHELNQQKTICYAVSDDGIRWQKRGVVMLRDPTRDYENIGVAGPVVLQDDNGTFRMWYSAIGTRWGFYSICYAESDDGILWRRGERYGENLQLTPAGTGWEQQMVEYPSVIREGDRLRMFYCGNGYGRTGIGTAVSLEFESRDSTRQSINNSTDSADDR